MNLAEQLVSRVKECSKSILVVGDTMTDVWVTGRTAPCQDGCLKFVQEEVIRVPGGAANAERCLSNWSVRTPLYGFYDNDQPIKTRYIEDDRIVFRTDDDDPSRHRVKYDMSRGLVMEMVWHADAVLLSDYDKGFLTPEFIHEVAGACNKRRVPCVADCKRAPEVYAGCLRKGNWLYSLHYADPIDVVTDGRNNPYVQGNVYGCDMPTVKCINHVGAGDCFAAHLTLSLAYGFSLKEAAAIAHSAGRVYVQHPFNRPPLPMEIVADMFSGM